MFPSLLSAQSKVNLTGEANAFRLLLALFAIQLPIKCFQVVGVIVNVQGLMGRSIVDQHSCHPVTWFQGKCL